MGLAKLCDERFEYACCDSSKLQPESYLVTSVVKVKVRAEVCNHVIDDYFI